MGERARGPAVCAWCGTPAPGTGVPLEWVTSIEGGVLRRYCGQCAREHLRSIEAKLDADWW